MSRRGAASAKRVMAMTNNEHAITLTDAELNEVEGGLNPQPLPPGPPPELSDLQYLPEFRNQSALQLHERIPPVLVLIYGGHPRRPRRDLLAPGSCVREPERWSGSRPFFPVPMPTK